MSHSSETQVLPLYGLAGAFAGDRWIEGEGRDLRTIVHSPVGMQGTLTVGVDRRTMAYNGLEARGAAISDDLARRSMATALIVDLPSVGDDVFEIASGLAGDATAWGRREVKVDGKTLTGYEREYEGAWIVYCLTDTLIIYVLAPMALRPEAVELKTLGRDDIRQREDWEWPTD
jgi:hypothetical protein